MAKFRRPQRWNSAISERRRVALRRVGDALRSKKKGNKLFKACIVDAHRRRDILKGRRETNHQHHHRPNSPNKAAGFGLRRVRPTFFLRHSFPLRHPVTGPNMPHPV